MSQATTEERLEELREALAHLHDPAFLETHPLATRIGFIAESPNLSRGQLLRRTLRLAIEALDPGSSVPPNAPEARPYQVLRGRYIARQSVARVAEQLDIGERQAYRELRRGLEGLSRLLEEYETGEGLRPGVRADQDVLSPAASVRREVERLSATDRQIVDLAQMLGEVVACVRPLASRCQIALEWTPASTEKLYVAVHRVMLRQAILNLLSHIIRTHQGKALPITLWRAGAQAMVRISYCAEMPTKSLEPDQPLGVATELLSSLDVAWEVLDVGGGIVHISISIPLAAQRTLLIIDDHQGLVRLFERYLEGQPYRVYSATEWDKALSLVEEIYPDIIILDVMMPDRDGWEVLQMLRQRPQGAQARVIVCSIINDPQLAAALGADGFLHKPVDRATLLHMLEAVAGSSLCT